MAREADPWTVKQVRGYWYYKLRNESVYHTTHIPVKNWKASKPRAERYAQEKAGMSTSFREIKTFGDYAAPYFLPEACPWFSREHGRGNLVQEHYRDQHRSRLEIHILPQFEHLRPEELSPVAIETWLYSLGYASQTKKHILETFKIVLKDMAREKLLGFSPHDFDPPVVKHDEKEIPTDREAAMLFPADHDEFKKVWGARYRLGVLCALAYSSGMRAGELRGLWWDAIHWDLGGLVVVMAITKDDRPGPPKAGSVRAIPLSRWTIDLLEALRKLSTRGDRYVFPGRTKGEYLDVGSINHALLAICRKKTDPDGKPIPGGKQYIETHLTPHGLRHAYNTRMREILAESEFGAFFDEKTGFQASTKATDAVLRAFTGHKSPTMTELYDHPELLKQLRFFDTHFREYVDRFWDFREKLARKGETHE